MTSKNYLDANKKKKLYEAESSMEHTSKIFDNLSKNIILFKINHFFFYHKWSVEVIYLTDLSAGTGQGGERYCLVLDWQLDIKT